MSFVDRLQFLLKKRSHYRAVFQHPSARHVLADLKHFCRWGQNPMVLGSDKHTDLFATGVAAGRQEVFRRIIGHIEVDDANLLRLREEVNDE